MQLQISTCLVPFSFAVLCFRNLILSFQPLCIIACEAMGCGQTWNIHVSELIRESVFSVDREIDCCNDSSHLGKVSQYYSHQ